MSRRVTLKPLAAPDRPLWDALAHLYAYDFSEMFDIVLDSDGTFPAHECFDMVWTDPDRHARLIFVGGEIAGFGIVRWYDDAFEVEQFLVLRKFRRCGVGRRAAALLFDAFQGSWIVDQVPENAAAIQFWSSVIEEYTDGKASHHVTPYPHQKFET